MTTFDNTVVSKCEPVSKLKFHDALMVGLTRLVRKLGGKGAAADALGFTGPAIDKVYNGGSMTLQRAFDALNHDECFLDEVASLYDKRIVPADAVCTSDRSHASVMVAGLHKIIEAEADGHKNHKELLGMEDEIRAMRAACDEIIAMIDGHRGIARLSVQGRVG